MPNSLYTFQPRPRETMLYPFERPEAYFQIRRDCVEALRPATNYEMYLVDQIADHHWRLHRIQQIECAYMDRLVARDPNPDQLGPLHQISELTTADIQRNSVLDVLARRRAQAERGIRRAQNTLFEFRKSCPTPAPLPPDYDPNIELKHYSDEEDHTTRENAAVEQTPSPSQPQAKAPYANWQPIPRQKIKFDKTKPISPDHPASSPPRDRAFSA